MKKYNLLLLLLSVIIILSACGSKDTSSKTDEEVYTFKMAHVVPEAHATHLTSVEFKEKVEELSEGRIKIDIYPNGQLYASEREGIEATVMGSLDLMFIGVPALASFDSKFMVLDLPFLFNSREEAHKALDEGLGDQLYEYVDELGLKGLGWGESGFKNMITNYGPTYTPNDFKGKTIRIMENKLYQDTFELLGAKANPHAFGELYSALQQKVFDGADQPVSLVASNKFYEVAPYYTLTEHVYAAALGIMNQKKFQELPEDLQKILEETGKEVFNNNRELAYSQDLEQLEIMKSKGLEVFDVTEEQKQELRDITAPVYEKYEKEIGKELIDLARSFSK